MKSVIEVKESSVSILLHFWFGHIFSIPQKAIFREDFDITIL